MSEPKTQKNDASVDRFIESVEDETKRDDCRVILDLMKKATKCEPAMWGTAIIGFGDQHFHGASKKGSDWFQIGFSPRKQNLTLYIMNGFSRYDELMAKLGKHSTGKSCLYIKRLSDVDMNILKELINESVTFFKSKYGKKKA